MAGRARRGQPEVAGHGLPVGDRSPVIRRIIGGVAQAAAGSDGGALGRGAGAPVVLPLTATRLVRSSAGLEHVGSGGGRLTRRVAGCALVLLPLAAI